MRIKLHGDNGKLKLTIKASSREIRMDENTEQLFRQPFKGLLMPEVRKTAVFGQCIITYTIPDRMPLDRYMQTDITADTLFSIVSQLASAAQKIEEQQLTSKNLLLDMRYVFAEPHSNQLFLAYIPLADGIGEGNISSFICRLLKTFSDKSVIRSSFAEELDDFIRSRGEVPANELCEFIRSKKNGYAGYNESGFMTESLAEYFEYCGEDEASEEYENKPETVTFRRTFSSANVCVWISRISTGDRITISKTVFRIGKDPSGADFCVSDNGAVSRIHADIIIRGSRYYILDHSSTNGTYINGSRIPPDTETEIYNGSCFRLGNEEFRFYID